MKRKGRKLIAALVLVTQTDEAHQCRYVELCIRTDSAFMNERAYLAAADAKAILWDKGGLRRLEREALEREGALSY